MVRSLSVLQEGRAWRCGDVSLKSTEPQIHLGSAVPLQQNPLVPFNWLQRKMLATPARSFAVSATTLYWKMRVYGDQRSPRNEVVVFGGLYLGFLPLAGGTCWPLMCLGPRRSTAIAHHCHFSQSLPFLPQRSGSALGNHPPARR